MQLELLYSVYMLKDMEKNCLILHITCAMNKENTDRSLLLCSLELPVQILEEHRLS
jgi:hypothetical protein